MNDCWIRKPTARPFLSETAGFGMTLLKSPLLSEIPGLTHAFTTREGGVSEGFLATMNLSVFLEPETPERVHENFRRLGEALGIPLSSLVLSRQTHTDNLRVVTANDAGKGITRERDYDDVDGLITEVGGLHLMVFGADCVPVLLADPVKKTAAAVHAGWRGSAMKIAGKAVRLLAERFGSEPRDLIAAIGPSICRECYEVGEEVADAFREAFGEKSREILFPATEPGKCLADLWAANLIALTEAGVRPEHIDVTDICTACNPDRLFSHRKTGGKRGLLGSVIGFDA